MSQLTPVPS